MSLIRWQATDAAAAAGGDVLAIANCAHAHSAETPTLVQHHVLTIADCAHGHTAENVTLAVTGTLAIADAAHAHSADSPSLVQHHVLTIADCAHAHAAENVVLVAQTVTIDDTVVQPYRVFQRSSPPSGTTGVIRLSGTYTGSPTDIQAYFDIGSGGTWTSLSNQSIAGGVWSGELTGDVGTGTVHVRAVYVGPTYSNTDTVTPISVGDIFIAYGQSNASGRGTTTTHRYDDTGYYDSGPLVGSMLRNAESSGRHQWGELADPTDSKTSQNASDPTYDSETPGGSFWPHMAGLLMKATGVPVAIVNVSREGQIVYWLGRNYYATWNTSPQPSHIYEELAQRIQQIADVATGGSPTPPLGMAGVIRGVLYFQGESNAVNTGTDAGGDYSADRAYYKTLLGTLAGQIYADFGVDMLVGQIGYCRTATVFPVTYAAGQVEPWDGLSNVRDAQILAWDDTSGDFAHIHRGPVTMDCDNGANSLHFGFGGTDPEGVMNQVAARFTACVHRQYYGGASTRGPRFVEARRISSTSFRVDFDADLDAPAGGYVTALQVFDGSTLLTNVASASPASGECSVVRDGTVHSRLTVTLGVAPSGALTVSCGQAKNGSTDIQESSLRTKVFPLFTTTFQGQTVQWIVEPFIQQAVGDVLAVADGTHSQTSDSPGLVQHHTLAIQDAAHAHTAENVTLTGSVQLAVADATHAHSADSPSLTQHHVLAIADCSHTHSAGSPALTQHHVLAVGDATHSHSVESPSLTQHHVLAVAAATHAHTADNVGLGVPGVLAIQDATHSHAAESPSVTQHHLLAVQDASHGHVGETPTLSVTHVLAIADCTHAHSAGNVVLVAVGTLTVADAAHAHSADNVALVQHHVLVIASAAHGHTAAVLVFGATLWRHAGRPAVLTKSAGKPVVITQET